MCRGAAKRVWRDTSATGAPLSHAAIERHLAAAAVHRVVSHDVSKFAHESYVLEIRDGASGLVSRALFKPRAEGDFDGWHRVTVERVAYALSRCLGMDAVPPCVYRDALTVEGRDFPNGGALIHYVDGARELGHVDCGDWGVGKAGLLSDTRVLVCPPGRPSHPPRSSCAQLQLFILSMSAQFVHPGGWCCSVGQAK